MRTTDRGYPVWWHRWLEAWWIVTGRWSLHRAWQQGKDRGHVEEMMRTAVLSDEWVEARRGSLHARRRNPNGGASVPSQVGSTAEVNAGGGSIAESKGADGHHEEGGG